MRIWIVLLGWLAVAGCGGVGLGATVPAKPPGTLASNKRIARQDARELLRSLHLPAGAVTLGHEPAGDHGWLRASPAIIGSQARAMTKAWWTASATPRSVLAFIEAHPPAGATRFETGGASDRSGSRMELVGYIWPAISGVLTARQLQVTITSLPGGSTGVLAEAQSDWFVPRPASERVPAGIRAIQLRDVATIPRRTILARTFTRSTTIRQIVSLIDAMPIVQPDVMNCPDLTLTNARVINLRFQGDRHQTLAQASYVDHPPLRQASRECNPVDFSVRGKPESPLVGGNFIERLERSAGVRLIP